MQHLRLHQTTNQSIFFPDWYTQAYMDRLLSRTKITFFRSGPYDSKMEALWDSILSTWKSSGLTVEQSKFKKMNSYIVQSSDDEGCISKQPLETLFETLNAL